MFAKFRKHDWDEHNPKYIPVKGKPFLMPAYTCRKCKAILVIEKYWRAELDASGYGCQPRPSVVDRIRGFIS